ncbi:phage portal protein [Hyphobacterium indicum]|uniref:phage portal protein n=1 Tax=Hyphobacterium indicum TaxID=2162714 RepID=UPI000D65B676|nr:phage portal protein [Hyphobacterium indicum]
MLNQLARTFGLTTKSSAAKPLIALSFGTRAAWPARDYASLSKEGFARNPVVHRCIRLIAEAAASTPLTMQTGGGAAHPLSYLLEQANPDQSFTEMLEAHYGFLQISGNAYLELAALDGVPREMFTLRPDRMRILPGKRGWPEGWEYSANGRKVTFARDRASGRSPILHMRLFHPSDDHYGLSPLEAAAASVDVHNAGGAWAKGLLDNAARPSGALIFNTGEGANLTDDQFDRLKAELSDAYTGPANAGRPMLLEGGLDWKPMALSPADMDFIEARREAAREIALAFGVPPLLLGLPGDNTYANYKEANLAFWRQTVLPLVRKTARALTGWLSPWSEAPLEITADTSAIPALSSERAADWARISAADFLTPDEKRRLLGLPEAS